MSRTGLSLRTGAGFTLVELLLAVTLMSLLMGLAYGGFRAATRATVSGQELLEETGRLRITHQFVRRQLNQMLPLRFDDGINDDPTVFLGDVLRVQYVAPMPGYLGQGGPQVQVIEVVESNAGLALIFSHALLQGFYPEALYERDPVVLLDGLQGAGFEFLEVDEQDAVVGWTTYWEDPAVMPKAVRLFVDLGEDSRVTWPVLAANVRVDETAVRQTSDVRDYSETIRDLIRNRQDRDE